MVAIVTKMLFVNVFSCGIDRALLDGHFGVLLDPCRGLLLLKPWSGSPKSSRFMVAMVTKMFFVNVSFKGLIGFD